MNKLTRIFAFAVIVAFLISCLPVSVFAASRSDSITIWNGSVASGFESGTGTKSDPYIIKSGEQLAYLANNVNSGNAYYKKFFSLVNDIYLNDIRSQITQDVNVSIYNIWNPIGTVGKPFEGIFCGNDYSIYGLICSNDTYAGFFGVTSHAEIYRLHIRNSYVKGDNYVGSITGYVSTTGDGIYYCSSDAFVRGTNYVGGLTGCHAGGYLYMNFFSGLVYGNKYVGGLTGSLSMATIDYCYNIGDVYGSSYCGGLAGYNPSSKIQYSYNAGAVQGGYAIVGKSYYSHNTCYYDSSKATGTTGIALSSSEMKKASSYKSFNFELYWNIDQKVNGGLPYLRENTAWVSVIEIYDLYSYLANNHPNYLNNSAYNGYISNCQSICNDVVQEYNGADNFWLSYAESFVNGTSIIVQNLFAGLGLGQSTQDEWLEKNTLEYIKRLQESENVVSESWKGIEKKYKDFKFAIKSVDIADSAILEREKYNFIKEISGRSSCFSEAEATKLADKLIKKQPNGISNFFTKIDYAVDLADILLYSCQMLDIEVSSLELLKNNIDLDTPLYHAIENRIMVIKSDPSGYVVEKYLTDEVTGKIAGFLDDFADWSAGAITGTDVSVTAKVVRSVSKILYEYVYGRLCGGVKIDEIYGAIVAYDFYSTTTSSWIDLLNQLCINKLNGTTNSDELLTNFKFMFEARRVALANYVDACIEIEKYGDYTSLLNDIKENTNDDGLLCFEKYVNTCFNTLKKDISNGTVSCNHGIFHVAKNIAPTCTAHGYSETVCDICGFIFQTNIVAALGHAYNTQTIVPTCTSEGYTHHLCARCGTSYDDNIVSMLEHCYQTTVVPATCTVNGYTVHTCKDCGYYYKDNFVDASGHLYGDWITDSYATQNSTGEKHRTCSICGYVETEQIEQPTELTFYGASLTLQNNLKVNFVVQKDLFEIYGYENPYAVFEMNDEEITVSEYIVSGSYYIFSYTDVSPERMNDTITATLYATYGGVEYSSTELKYSIAQYCYSMLSKETTADKLRTLLVDLLHYGAASQIYTNHNVKSLADASLTEEQLAWGTENDPELTSITNPNYNTISSPSVLWKGVSLNLKDSITMQFVFSSENINGLTIRVEDQYGSIIEEISKDFVKSGGFYIAKFKGLTAGQMSETVYLTAYSGDKAISNTVAYSIESYAYSKQNDMDVKLATLVKSMMKYGNSAYAYAN